MTAHSSVVGGSIAKRRIICPASYQESLKAPPGTSSVYADHGTAMHDAMTYWLKNPDDDLVGLTFYEHVVTEEDVDSLLTPAWDALVDLQENYGGGFKVAFLEKQVVFPGIPGAFGTCDVILISPSHFLLVDFKFGAGIQVVAYDDGGINAQLLFYLAGARKLAKGRVMVVAIIQPTFEPRLTSTTVMVKEVTAFEKTLQDAVALALSPDPPRVRSAECRFAPCKLTCPLWAGPLLDLTALGRPPAALPASQDWGIWLAAAKRLVDSALMYQKEIDEALMEHLKGGGKAPGFALKPVVKNRKWLDNVDLVANTLRRVGLPEDKIWQRKIQTFAVVDAAAKKLNVEIPDALRPRPESNDFVLTYAEDPQAVNPQIIATEFSVALKKLDATQKGNRS